jgi:hypothetical protein
MLLDPNVTGKGLERVTISPLALLANITTSYRLDMAVSRAPVSTLN